MSTKYKVHNDHVPHFITCTVIGWADALSRPEYKDIIVDSIKYCQEHKNLLVHAWVIMNNHIHMIVSSETNMLPGIIRDFKKFTSRKLMEAISNNPQESRKQWLLNMFRFVGTHNNNNDEYQFWQQDYHPVELNDAKKYQQRLTYLHENPIRAGIVWQPSDYKYSSAIDYYEQRNGLLVLNIL